MRHARTLCAAIAPLAVAAVAGCQAPALPVGDEHRALFAGEYRGAPSGGLTAELLVTPELSYVYEQDLGDASRLDRIKQSGQLRVTGPHSATAGRVRLNWKTKNSVEVYSPHGSSFDPDPVSGGDYMSGHQFTMRRQGGSAESLVLGKVTVTMEPRKPECEAQVSISYVQRNTKVDVETTVEQDGCMASSGDYALRLRTIDGEGEIDTRKFEESWTRSSPGTVRAEKTYDIGGGRRLISAQVSTAPATNCRCDEVAAPAVPSPR